MDVKRDLIASVTGENHSYKLSRVVLDADGNGAVFIAGQTDPATTFTVTKDAPQGGTGTTPDGSTIRYRRRGASCTYALAKCNVKTPTLVTRWEAWLAS